MKTMVGLSGGEPPRLLVITIVITFVVLFLIVIFFAVSREGPAEGVR
jgi:hypothetical protein